MTVLKASLIHIRPFVVIIHDDNLIEVERVFVTVIFLKLAESGELSTHHNSH